MSCTFDTNILVYTLGQPADVKRQRAQSLIIRGARRQTAVLLLQSLAEFSYVATRKFGISVASVRRRVDGWCGGFPVHPAVEPDLAAGSRSCQRAQHLLLGCAAVRYFDPDGPEFSYDGRFAGWAIPARPNDRKPLPACQ